MVSDWSFSGSEIENCNAVDRGGVAHGNIVVGLRVDCEGEVGVSTGEAGVDGTFEGEQTGERNLTTGLLWKSKPEDVKGWKSSSGSEKTERQSSQGGKFECSAT